VVPTDGPGSAPLCYKDRAPAAEIVAAHAGSPLRQAKEPIEEVTWIDRVPRWARRSGGLLLSANRRVNALHEWRRRRSGEPAVDGQRIQRVLVICHGNICRSPFAGNLLARERPGLEVRSAGLEAREGKPAEEGARRVARRFEIDLEDHGAHLVDGADVEWADLILGMEGHHTATLCRRWPAGAGKTFLLGDFLPAPPHRIDDPWGREDAVFIETFEIIRLAVERLAARLAGERA
jgi:protein-tyrosine phosphatase